MRAHGRGTCAAQACRRVGALRAGPVAIAAVAIALSIALLPALDPAESQPLDPPPAPHLSLLPDAHASHSGPRLCTNPFWKEPASLWFTSPNGTYVIGENIFIRIAATPNQQGSAARIDGSSASHWIYDTILVMGTGGAGSNATFSGPGLSNFMDHLNYRYTVREGDYSEDLDYNSTSALWQGDPTTSAARNLQASARNLDCRLQEPGREGSLSYQSDIVVDGIRPRALNVTAVQNGTYGIGSVISVNASFSEAVLFPPESPPTLALGLDGANVDAVYARGNGTAVLVFNYTVRDGDTSAALGYNASNAMAGSGIADAPGNAANLTLPARGDPGSLGASSRVVVDGVRPSVVRVSSPDGTGPHGIGTAINVTVAFSEDVSANVSGGTPYLELETGGTDRRAVYASQAGPRDLLFQYTVMDNDTAADLGHRGASALALNGSTITDDSAGNPANVTTLSMSGLPAGDTLAGSSNLAVDGVRPSVVRVSSPDGAGPHGIGTAINVTVAFSEDVSVDVSGGTPYLELETGGTDRRAVYVSQAGPRDLLFRYTVMDNDTAADLGHMGASALVLNGSTITDDSAGNPADETTLSMSGLPAGDTLAGSSNLAVDGIRPSVLSVSSPDADSTYGIGSAINVTVAFSEDVSVDVSGGTPYIALGTDGAERRAAYASQQSARELVFRYTVMENDTAAGLDYAGPSALRLNGGVIRDDPAGNEADQASLSLAGLSGSATLAGSSNLAVDGVRPSILSVSPLNATGTYYANQHIHINVTFDEAVSVTGAPPPSLRLNASSAVRDGVRAEYAYGSPGASLVFVYDVRIGDDDGHLDYVNGSSLLLDGDAAIRDAAGNGAGLALPPHGPRGSSVAGRAIAIDPAVVSVAAVTSPDADGAYAAGARINITVTFTDPVSVAGGPPLLLLDAGGAGGRSAAYASGSGAAELAFVYAVQAGDNTGDLGYAGGSALMLNGGTIAPAAGTGHPVKLFLPDPGHRESLSGSKDIVIDTAAPEAVRVSSPNRTGSYAAGDTLHVVVAFSENVTVDTARGRPSLLLETVGAGAAGAAAAAYASGSGSPDIVFAYTVAAGDASPDLGYAGASALSLNGGAITDAAGNDADLALPAPGSPASLSGTGDISVRGGPAVPECAATVEPAGIGFGNVSAGEPTAAVVQVVRMAGSLPLAKVWVGATGWMPDGAGAGAAPAMPAGATSVMSGAGAWTPLDGEVGIDVRADGSQAAAKFRLDVPPQAAPPPGGPAVGMSQTITYTASCDAPAG